ncbi:hypothetical protein ACH347_24170 [Saccharopolyspora sp. 5N102]|uniref:hypothetical protein n=1 Tax=Saccharopolyspora sp. 5N102 TaxID=3375155 RepID=UPI0037A75C20
MTLPDLCTGSAGQSGDADTKPAPATLTIDGKQPPSHEDHDLRLEYLRHEAL